MTNLLPERAESLCVARSMALRKHFTHKVKPLNWGLPYRSYEEQQETLWRLSPPITLEQLQEDYPEIFGGKQ